MHELLLILLLFDAPENEAQESRQARQIACLEVKRQLRHVESRLRAGYTRAQGERLEARRRKLRKKRFRLCR